jgi:uncharacterized protein YfiM (DUF2279 family)
MNRDEFYAKLAVLNENRLQVVLWNLYWRGSAPMRQRIEAQLDPDEHRQRRSRAPEPPDPAAVLSEVSDFLALARAGAYLAGDRRVSPRERSRWRLTFRRLATDAEQVLRSEDLDTAGAAVELLIDLACETRGYDYFRSEDPVQAAGFVVSEAVAQLWTTMRDRHGFAGFADRAAPQLIRWESPYGWTRYGTGRIADKEKSLVEVLAGLLRAPDHWAGFAARYLAALDQLAGCGASATRHPQQTADRDRQERARALAEWHGKLLDRLADSESDDLLDRLVVHPALSGPELTFLKAQLAHRRGDADHARSLMDGCLQTLPGHQGFHAFVDSIGPPRSARTQATDAKHSR